MTSPSVPAYGPLAAAYDLIHREKPYGRDARTIRSLARRYARRRCRTLLEVACGSGRYLEQFTRWYTCAGLDASAEMLARARRRAPRAALALGRMESLNLGRQFDLVVCLFSSIGYVRSTADLRRTVRGLAQHTAAGGIVVLEPWLTPSAVRLGPVHYVVAEGDGTTVVRMNGCRLRRNRTIFDFHYLVGKNGRVQHFIETHDLGLFDRRTMTSALRDAGLEVHYLPIGLSSRRGLYIGRKPLPAARELATATGARSPRPGAR